MKKERKELGLCDLVIQLGKELPDESEVSIVVGLSVLTGLMAFESKTNSPETLAFEQVKAVYKKLEEVTRLMSEARSQKFNLVYSTLNGEIEASLGRALERGTKRTSLRAGDIESLRRDVLLYPKMSWTLEEHRRSYLDLLRRMGGALVADVKERGTPHQKRSMLFADYRSIETNFINGRFVYVGTAIP